MMPQPMDPRQVQLAQEKMMVAQAAARVMWLEKREGWLDEWIKEFRYVHGAQSMPGQPQLDNVNPLMLYVRYELSKMNTELVEIKTELFGLKESLARYANKSTIVAPVFVPPGRLS